MSQDDHGSLPQGWTLNKQAVEQTQDFWAKRAGVSLTVDEAREGIHNMAMFADILLTWSAHGSSTKEEPQLAETRRRVESQPKEKSPTVEKISRKKSCTKRTSSRRPAEPEQ